MGLIDVDSRTIPAANNEKICFSSADIHKVFDLPTGGIVICRDASSTCPETIKFIRNAIGMAEGGRHSLKTVETYLLGELNDKSSSIEKSCFQIAYVIFVMGHLLDPSTKHEYTTMDFWSAIKDAEHISDFDWCDYVLQ
jgi:hypothetical protein